MRASHIFPNPFAIYGVFAAPRGKATNRGSSSASARNADACELGRLLALSWSGSAHERRHDPVEGPSR